MTEFVISDPHFYHRKIIRLCQRRPEGRRDLFYDEFEMNDYIITKWNSVVKPNDSVRLLGDVALCKNFSELKSIMKLLNGHIHVITGNHDHYSSLVRARLDNCNLSSVTDGIMLWDNRFLLSHVPVSNPKYVNLHGHLHDANSPTAMHINVCVEKWDYTPVAMEMIEKVVKERKLC